MRDSNSTKSVYAKQNQIGGLLSNNVAHCIIIIPHFPENLDLLRLSLPARLPDTLTSWLHSLHNMKQQDGDEHTEDDAEEGLHQRFFYHVVINSSLFLAGVLSSWLADEISLTRQSFSKKFVGGLDISAHINAQTTVSAHMKCQCIQVKKFCLGKLKMVKIDPRNEEVCIKMIPAML